MLRNELTSQTVGSFRAYLIRRGYVEEDVENHDWECYRLRAPRAELGRLVVIYFNMSGPRENSYEGFSIFEGDYDLIRAWHRNQRRKVTC